MAIIILNLFEELQDQFLLAHFVFQSTFSSEI
jgi:hypothetical protein